MILSPNRIKGNPSNGDIHKARYYHYDYFINQLGTEQPKKQRLWILLSWNLLTINNLVVYTSLHETSIPSRRLMKKTTVNWQVWILSSHLQQSQGNARSKSHFSSNSFKQIIFGSRFCILQPHQIWQAACHASICPSM